MKAAQLVGPRRFEFVDVPEPEAGDGQVFIRTEYASICDSDLRYYDRTYAEDEYPLGPGDPCHEVAGVVEESRDPRFRRGQRVIALKNANLSQYAAVNGDDLVALPEGSTIDPSLWIICQPLGTVLYALQQAGSMAGKRVVILGQGPIGLKFTQLIAGSGARQVIVTDRHGYRLERARANGATHVIDVSAEDPLEAITSITKGELADVVVEAAGRPETCNLIFQALRVRGQAMIFGLAHDETVFPFDWGTMGIKVPNIVVTNSSRAGDRTKSVEAAVDLVAQGRFDVAPYQTHRFGWLDAGKAYETYSTKADDSLKVVMEVS